MRISDWSSDVCSADLIDVRNFELRGAIRRQAEFVLAEHEHQLGRQNGRRLSGNVRGVYGLRGEENARCAIFSLGEVEVEHFVRFGFRCVRIGRAAHCPRSEEHTSELQSLMRISYAVFCLKKKKTNTTKPFNKQITEYATQNNTERST